MSDDWLEHGHGTNASNLALVFSRTPSSVENAHGGRVASRRSRFTGSVSVAVVAAMAALGSAGAMHAIRDALFPSLGAPTSPSVWQNPAPAEPAMTTAVSTTTTVVPVEETVTRPPGTTGRDGLVESGQRPSDDSSSDNSGRGSVDTHATTSTSGNSASTNPGSGSDDNSGHGSGDTPSSSSGSSGSGSGSNDTRHGDG